MQLKAHIRAPTITANLYRSTSEQTYMTYDGEYKVIPKTYSQELETQNRVMHENLKILEIPYYEVSNENGTTVIIAD